ncbi:MAG TPA: alpha/beta fold hydrolase [Stellaceae bacterium]|nr:alpha/beta fold hydrolase [Stellaceae bacterium]
MKRPLIARLAGAILAAGLLISSPAFALGLDPAFPEPTLGPAQAKGVVVWSHGRSINSEDYKSPTPIYLEALRNDGWDVLRFDRLSRGDTLTASSKRLAEYAADLKREGYRQVVLAGQSFGGFLALMAADASTDVDAVVATAPAAYGNFEEFYDSWRLNATKLYPLLQDVKSARVMVFYFHDDDFDPGGRGEHSRAILSHTGRGYAVIDQPAYLSSHWAASTGLFLRRFGNCIRNFADDSGLSGEMVCHPRWGTIPSAEMKLPPELPATAHPQRVAAVGSAGRTGSGRSAAAGQTTDGFRDVWYGFYPNGREVLLGVETVHGDKLTAVYAIGPSIDNRHPASWSRRKGRIVGDSFVFQEAEKSTLRFRPTEDGGLEATWMSSDGKMSMDAHLKPIDPQELAQRADAAPAEVAPVKAEPARTEPAKASAASAPVGSTAANRNSG